MRGVAVLALLCAGCPSPTQEEHWDASVDASRANIPVAPACRVLYRGPGTGVSGKLLSLDIPDAGILFVAQSLGAGSAGFMLPPDAPADGCLASAGPPLNVIAPPPGGGVARPLSLTAAGGKRWLFYALERADPSAPFGVRVDGYGVAAQQEETGVFQPTASLLWTADRPAYGTAAVVEDGFLYAYGCAAHGFMGQHCFVARAPVDRVADESAYTYYEGGGHWIASVDSAWPVVEAGAQPSVHYDANRRRYLLVYAGVLDHVLNVRTGLRPEGPWSAPRVLAGCEQPVEDPQAFCGDVAVHPGLPWPDGGVTLSYSVGSLEHPAAADDYLTRLARVDLPADLP